MSLPLSAKDIIVLQYGGRVTSIHQAIESANNGDRIIVKQGFYNEGNIIIDKSVELIGENLPVIDGANNTEIITVHADNVLIRGFIVQNSGASNLKDMAGIKIENSKNCRIESNELINNFFAVYLGNSSYCSVISNNIHSNAVSESSSGNGIHLWKCNNILIDNNSVTGHRDGIYFEFVTNSKVTGNISRNNLRYGLHFMFSHGDTYENNTFGSNGAGVAVMYTKNVKMISNRFENNWGPNAYGLLLKDIENSFIFKNTFYKNTTAVFMEGGIRLYFNDNDFTENGWAMKIQGDCTDDTLIHNNFTGNTFDISTNSSRNPNVFSENYWDKYNGYDLNRDGIGDVPYRPVSLFSIMIDRTPETIFLLRSFIVNLLDLAEKVAPVFIPETLTDEHPLMAKYFDNNNLYGLNSSPCIKQDNGIRK
jgi:nitrous oxidase accessory protein